MNDKQSRYGLGWAFVVLAVAVMLASTAWAGTEKVIYSFTGGSDGANPATNLTFDSAGNAYGTTAAGGDFGWGTVFKLAPNPDGSWTESVLYSFSGFGDGLSPHGGVIFDDAGNLYGTTVAGGVGGICAGDGCGVVFRLAPNPDGTWTQSVIYNFTGGNDGFGPGSGLVRLPKTGDLFGTTPDGGADGMGVVYQLRENKHGNWRLKVIHTFTGGNDGGIGSLGSLLLDGDGNIFGIAELGGKHGAGTAYEIRLTKAGHWRLRTIYAFQGQPDAGFPYGGLIFDKESNVYGTTYFGGANGVGSVYKLTRQPGDTWSESVLYSFKGGKDGAMSTATLFRDADGNLYGTTSEGGNLGCSCGVIFKMTRGPHGKYTESVAYRFKSVPDGAYSYYGLTPDGLGNLFGTTAAGGIHNQGAIFEFTP
jgi:uncharacterized repeat protein (TIGR03803 family)